MKNSLFIILAFGLSSATNADHCISSCKNDLTTKCEKLTYFIENCSTCGTVSKQCSKSFCQNHPNNCDENGPLKNLSIDTMSVNNKGVISDVCIAKLFPTMEFENHENGDLNITNLNMLGYAFFAQTGGKASERNIATLRKLIANYLVYKDVGTNLIIPNLGVYVDQWLISIFKKPIGPNLTPFDFHMIAEFVRRDLYIRKGINTQTKTERYQGQNYPMTVSNLGCKGETNPDINTPRTNSSSSKTTN